jgi:hypothetical protein
MARTVRDLIVIAAEFPDAPKWWLGDWVNAGQERFSVSDEEAFSTGKAAASMFRATRDDDAELPEGVGIDATSAVFAAEVTKDEWTRVGGVFFALHDEIKD